MLNYVYFNYKRKLFFPKEKYALVSDLPQETCLTIMEILANNCGGKIEIITPNSKEKEKFLEICLQTRKSNDGKFCEIKLIDSINAKIILDFKTPIYYLEEKTRIKTIKEGE